jgi:hypothetical protein
VCDRRQRWDVQVAAGAEHKWRSGALAVVWSLTYLEALGFAPLRPLTDLAVLPMTLRRKSYHVWTSRSAVSRPDSVIFFATSDVHSTSCGNASSTVTTNLPAASIAGPPRMPASATLSAGHAESPNSAYGGRCR